MACRFATRTQRRRTTGTFELLVGTNQAEQLKTIQIEEHGALIVRAVHLVVGRQFVSNLLELFEICFRQYEASEILVHLHFTALDGHKRSIRDGVREQSRETLCAKDMTIGAWGFGVCGRFNVTRNANFGYLLIQWMAI